MLWAEHPLEALHRPLLHLLGLVKLSLVLVDDTQVIDSLER